MCGMADDSAHDGEATPLRVDARSRRVAHQHGLTWTDPETGDGYLVRLRYAFMAGRLECTELKVSALDRPITASQVRRIPLHGLRANDRVSAREMVAEMMKSGVLTDAERAKARERLPGYERATPGRPRITVELLIEVAEVYLGATAKPTTAVCEHFKGTPNQVSYSTAAKWVMKAREAGLIPPARTKTGRKGSER